MYIGGIMTKKQKMIVTIALFTATFMSAIEGTIVTTAMPTIIASLDGLSIMNWVFSIYLLMSAIMTPIYGKLADLKSRKLVFTTGIMLFVIGSFLCGLAQSMEWLIFSRLIQGIGAGAILPISLTIIDDIFPADQKAKIMGLNNAAWGIASIVAPLIGGFIVEHFSWHWIFLINVPIGLVVSILMFCFYREVPRETTKNTKMDIKGAFVLMLFLLSFLYMFQVIGEKGFLNLVVFFCLVISVLSLIVFIFIEKRADDPIIAPAFFKSKMMITLNVITFFVSGLLTGIEVYTPMWLQTLNGTSAIFSGMALAPMSILWMVGSFVVGYLLSKTKVHNILMIGILFLVVGAISYQLLPLHTPYMVFCFIGVLLGIGFGMTLTTTTIAVQDNADTHLVGSATALNTLFRTLGQSVMVAVYGTILNVMMAKSMAHYPQVTDRLLNEFMNVQTSNHLAKNLLSNLRHIMYTGLHSIFTVSLIVILLSFILIIMFKLNKERKKEA